MKIDSWLEELGLGKYSELFKKNGFTFDSLSRITTSKELQEIGIKSSIIREKILYEISKLTSNTIKGTAPSSPSQKSTGISQQTISSSSIIVANKEIQRLHPSPKKVLNEYEEAIIKNNKDLKSKIKELGEDHEEVGDCYYELGTNYYMNSQYENAIENHKKALAIRIKCFGEDDVDVVISYYQLGQDYYMDCKYELAITNHIKALELQNLLNEDDDHNEGVAAISFDLAKDYYYNSQYDNAIIYLENALEIRRYVFGDEHKDVADVYYHMGLAYQSKFHDKKALSNFKIAHSIYVETNGKFSDEATKMEGLINDMNEEIDD